VFDSLHRFETKRKEVLHMAEEMKKKKVEAADVAELLKDLPEADVRKAYNVIIGMMLIRGEAELDKAS
jgi:ribosomal 50S subunit-associated protein YjgA (DUF615 family)